jgi:hypothetical protein
MWNEQAFLKASNPGIFNYFGNSVSIWGDTIVVGSYQENSAATGVNGDPNVGEIKNAGAAYVFVRNGISWSQQAYLKSNNPSIDELFGISVSISGETIVVGVERADFDAEDSGAAYVFVRSGSKWTLQQILRSTTSSNPKNANFGHSVSISGERIVVGAVYEANRGRAYVFERVGTTWTQTAQLLDDNTRSTDHFGVSVSISGDTIVVGAELEDSNAAGVNGGQNNWNAISSGAAYVFVKCTLDSASLSQS